jgi:hypothetical protein
MEKVHISSRGIFETLFFMKQAASTVEARRLVLSLQLKTTCRTVWLAGAFEFIALI